MLKFLKVREEDLGLILDWRTSPDVTRYMFTDIARDMDRQNDWYQKIQNDESSRHWIVSYQDRRIGMVYLTGMDFSSRQCTWGVYIGDASSRMIGGIVPPYLFNHVFHQMGFARIFAEIMEGNENAIKLNELFGFKLIERRENHIRKYDKNHDVFLYELRAEAWDPSGKYKKFTAEFE